MSRAGQLAAMVCCIPLASCGAHSSAATSSASAAAGGHERGNSTDEDGAWIGTAEPVAGRRGGPRHRSAAATAAARPAPGEVLTPGRRPAEGHSRPPRVGGRDVRFHQATVEQALSFLAAAGGFNLVVQGEFPSVVTLDLFEVEPYDAVLILAETHGGTVRYQSNVVIVSELAPPAPAAAPAK